MTAWEAATGDFAQSSSRILPLVCVHMLSLQPFACETAAAGLLLQLVNLALRHPLL